jgi:SAM-dependent methyltransferase
MCVQQAAIINDYQRKEYEKYEKDTADNLVKQYAGFLEKIKQKDNIKILDIGGAGGHFSLALYNYFSKKDCEITVLDNTRYSTWNEFGNRIKFVEDSVDNLEKIFLKNTFDLVFANRVFHHFVKETWRNTITGITNIMMQISKILKCDGYFCITDYFYDGRIFDTAASRIIYTLTSCKIPLLVKIFRKIEAKSAGIGVCFLSRCMWLNNLNGCGFIIDELYEGHKLPRRFFRMLIYKIFLLIKNCQEDIILICKLKL